MKTVDIEGHFIRYIADSHDDKNENANHGKSISGMKSSLLKLVVSSETIRQLLEDANSYERELFKANTIHVHKAEGSVYAPYCCGLSLEKLLHEGLGVGSAVRSRPAKHLDVAIDHMGTLIQIMANEYEGAVAFSGVDTLLAPFIDKDKLEYRDVKQCIQRFVYGLNYESRQAFQTPFSNVTFDFDVPESDRDKYAIIGGEIYDKPYGELQRESDMIKQAFFEVLSEGDANGAPFTFPIPTFKIFGDKDRLLDLEDPVSRQLWDLTCKTGAPYFANYTNRTEDAALSMCCRLNIDLDEVRGTGLWNIGSSTGSLAINTINLNAVACKSLLDHIDFFDLLRDVCDLTAKMLLKRKDYILYGYEHGLLPYTRGYINTLETFFLTIGLVGAADAYVNYYRKRIDDIKDFTDFCVNILNTINERVEYYKANSDWKLWNVEQSPAEGSAHSLARRDRRLYRCYTGGIAGSEYLTNSTHLPVDMQLTLEHIKHRSVTDNLYSGGTLLNFYTSEVMESARTMQLIKRLVIKSQLPYVAYTPTFKVCPVHGYAGIGIERCKDCGRELVNYTRVVGYIRPTTRFNPGQLRQFMDRRYSSA